jgi:hypothetical protein
MTVFMGIPRKTRHTISRTFWIVPGELLGESVLFVRSGVLRVVTMRHHAVWQKFTDISQEHTASIFWVKK